MVVGVESQRRVLLISIHTAHSHTAAPPRTTRAPSKRQANIATGNAAIAIVSGALILGNVVMGTSLVPALLGRGAPFVKTAAAKVHALFGDKGLLRAGPTSLLPTPEPGRSLRLVDLGSGDGALLRAATRSAGFSATGYEINPFLVAYARARSTSGPGSEQTHWRSLWDAPLNEADVVLIYGTPHIMGRLGAKLRDELRPGAIVVSNCYKLPEGALGPIVKRVFVDTPRWSADVSSNLFAYRKA